MTTMFYAIVSAITEVITGLDGDALKLWEFGTYVQTYDKVTLIVNIIVLAVLISVGCNLINCTVSIVKYIKNRKALLK